MTLHQRTHPDPVDGCFGCRIASVQMSQAAMPTRHPAVAQASVTDKRWERDHAAYRRLRAQGLQPEGIDGAHQMEAQARTRFEIESGRPMPKDIPTKRLRALINEGHEISAANNVPAAVGVED